MHLVLMPFKGAYYLVYGLCRFFGHGLTLFAMVALVWLICIERGEMVEFFVASTGLLVVNRTLNMAANAIRPKPRMKQTVERAPEAEAPIMPQLVTVAVSRHSAPSARATKRMLSPELRQLIG